MSVIADNIKFYASASMPTGDSLTSGGAINSGIMITFTDVSGTNNVEIVSDNAGDTQAYTFIGRNGAGQVITDSGSLSGTTVVTTTTAFDRLLRFSIASVPAGIITLRDNVLSGTIAQFSGQVTGIYRPFYNATANAAGGLDKELKEKFFIRNDNAATALTSVTLQELASGLYTKVSFAVSNNFNDTESIASRTGTNPTGTGGNFSSADRAVPGGDISTGQAIGIWLNLDLNAGDAADNDTYVIRVNGSTT